MSDKSNASGGGIGFFGLLTIAFIVLKLTNTIDWSWKWILAPIWIPAAVGIGIALICLLVWAAIKGAEIYRDSQRRKRFKQRNRAA